MDISPNGGTVAWVDAQGCTRRIDGVTGALTWQTAPRAGVNAVVASPLGEVITYSRLNPARAELRVLDARFGGKRYTTLPLDGAVWGVAVSASGAQAVALTGARSVHILPLTPPRQSAAPKLSAKPVAAPALPPATPFSWRTVGVPDSVALSPRAPVAAIGSWQSGAGVGLWDLNRGVSVPRWLYRETEAGRTFTVHLSGDGGTVVAVSGVGPKGDRARAQAWSAETGKPLFQYDLDGFGAEAQVSAHGDIIVISYSHLARYSTGNQTERRLLAFDRSGERIFTEKGGLYFAPRLVCLSQDGTRMTVQDGERSLYTLDAQGKFLSKMRFAPDKASIDDVPTIKATNASEDGAYLLVWRGDGMLTLLKAATS